MRLAKNGSYDWVNRLRPDYSLVLRAMLESLNAFHSPVVLTGGVWEGFGWCPEEALNHVKSLDIFVNVD